MTARARWRRASPTPLTDVVREQPCLGPRAAEGLPVGARHAQSAKALPALAPHASRATANFVKRSFPSTLGKAVPPVWKQLADVLVWQGDSEASGDSKGRGP